jgi:hypothetical protein
LYTTARSHVIRSDLFTAFDSANTVWWKLHLTIMVDKTERDLCRTVTFCFHI